ncbi:MAG: agmatine deiminase family protein [Pseudomonadota bacterium]
MEESNLVRRNSNAQSSRRSALKRTLGTALLSVGAFRASRAARSESGTLRMPDESAPHARTWMAFVANDYIWASRQVQRVKQDLIAIAKTVAKYEPVSMLVAPEDEREARALLSARGGSRYSIDLVPFAVDDLWLRDTGPVFVRDARGQRAAIDFNFNGWGDKQDHELDRQVARFIAAKSGVPHVPSELVLEGGCFEVDGDGTAIMARSCILNPNRNPGVSEAEAEAELKALLGLEKIIWLNGIAGKDITDGHTDFYARFTHPGQAVVARDDDTASHDHAVTRENIEILKRSRDARGRKLSLSILEAPWDFNDAYGDEDFAAGYIGYYVCNGAVIAQKFGDRRADASARRTLRAAFPDRTIEQIAIDGIASGGGSIHCATQQEIAV